MAVAPAGRLKDWHHSGRYQLPGGRREAGDQTAAAVEIATAAAAAALCCDPIRARSPPHQAAPADRDKLFFVLIHFDIYVYAPAVLLCCVFSDSCVFRRLCCCIGSLLLFIAVRSAGRRVWPAGVSGLGGRTRLVPVRQQRPWLRRRLVRR